jgi:hypothetical protein
MSEALLAEGLPPAAQGRQALAQLRKEVSFHKGGIYTALLTSRLNSGSNEK